MAIKFAFRLSHQNLAITCMSLFSYRDITLASENGRHLPISEIFRELRHYTKTSDGVAFGVRFHKEERT